MSDSIRQSSEFEIKSMVIASPKTNIQVDIRGIFEEMNIYDSVLLNSISGNIIIVDSIGILKGFEFDGSEYLLIEMSKITDLFPFKAVFHIYKQSRKDILTQGSVSYQLNFISDEYTVSEQTRVAQHYETTYSNIANLILKDYIKLAPSKSKGIINPSQGIRSVIIPTMKPLDALTWCSKRALDVNDKPTFLFYENFDGYNFASITDIFKQTPLANINFTPKNLTNNLNVEFFGVRDYEVLDQFDFIENTKSGVYAKTGRFYDINNRTYKEFKTNFNQDQSGVGSANANKNIPPSKNNIFNIRPEQAYSSKIESYFYNSKLTGKEETPDKWLLQREAIMQNLFARKIRVVMAGNFLYTSGKLMNVFVPKFSVSASNDSDSGLDKFLSGNYLIVSTKHTLRAESREHTTTMDLVTDSTT
jgi:hypothetical protein